MRNKIARRYRKEDPVGFVYFIHFKDTGLIKIGWASKLRRRFSQLHGKYNQDFTCLGVKQSVRSMETRMHDRFKDYRVDSEIYQPVDDLILYIQENTIPSPDSVPRFTPKLIGKRNKKGNT